MSRPDLAPKHFRSYRPVTGKIIKQAEVVNKLQEEYKAAPDEKPIFRKNPKTVIGNSLVAQTEELKNLLASTPRSSTLGKPEYSDEVLESNIEAIEVQFSLDNLKDVLRESTQKMHLDPKNLDNAEKYYLCYLVIVAAILEMSSTYLQNIEDKYKPAIGRQTARIQNLIRETESRLQQTKYEEANRKHVEALLENQKKVLAKLFDALEKLEEQKIWIRTKIPKLEETKGVLQISLKTVIETKNAQLIINTIMSNFDSLAFSPPPLIVFEVDDNNLDLHNAPGKI